MLKTTATRRLMKEFKELSKNSPEGILAAPMSDGNMFQWEAVIRYIYYSCFKFEFLIKFSAADLSIHLSKMGFLKPF